LNRDSNVISSFPFVNFGFSLQFGIEKKKQSEPL